jgi:hypothetical protein
MNNKKEYIILGLSVAAIAALSLTPSSCVSIQKESKRSGRFKKINTKASGSRSHGLILNSNRGLTKEELPKKAVA